MDEEKAAAYYEELTRKGGGAAKFKQGLGFSSTSNHNDSNHDDGPPKLGSALVSSSSFLSAFVKASGTTATANTTSTSQPNKQLQLQSIQNKLKKKHNSPPSSRVSERSHRERRRSPSLDRDRALRRRSRSRERDRDRDRRSRKRSSSTERHRGRDRDRSRERGRKRRSRSRSRSDSEGDRRKKDRRKNGSRSKSSSPRNHRKSGSSARDSGVVSKGGKSGKGQNAVIDYECLIEGYDKMTQAERVKAKMKLQLSETAEKDRDTGPGWERFQFNKDAPVEDEEIEAAEDDAAVVKHIGQSFRFSTVEARRENQIKAAHDEAMFGVPELPLSVDTDSELDKEDTQGDRNKELDKKNVAASLLSESVLAMQKGSWRDRVRNA